MTTDLMKLMAYIDSLQSEPTPEPIIETETKVHPLLQAMQELKEEGIVESTDDIKDQIEKAIIVDGGNWDEYFVRSSQVDKIGYSTKQQYGRSPDLDHPEYDIDYIGSGIGKPALWFYPVSYYLKKKDVFGQEYPYIWLVRLRPDAWLQPVDRFTKSIQPAPKGKERVGILKQRMIPAAIFFKPAFNVVDKFVNYKSLHKPHGLVKGPQVDEEYTFDQQRRQLNIPELIKRGAFYITHPHGPDGWETDRPDWDFSLITLQNILQKSPDWSVEYKKYIRPESYNKATQEFFSKLSDQKYQQILWSINKLGIPDDVAFLDKLDEASPNTLEGSFTPDLVESKTWLAKMLAKGLKGKNAGTIYVLGSWYGNMGIFLQQADVKFDKLVLIEPNEDWLMQSKDLLDTLNDEGKLVLIHQKAEDVVYEKPGVVINTSCNETGPVFLTKLPDNMLCLLQARNNVDNVLIETDNLEEFKDLFSLNKIYYAGEKHLTDPETDYTRYMIIGRTGKSQENGIDE